MDEKHIMRRMIEIIFSDTMIAVLFLIYFTISLFKRIYFYSMEGVNYVLIAEICTFLLIATIGFFALKKNRYAKLAIAALIMLTGIWIFIVSLFLASETNSVFKIQFFVLAFYFLNGGVLLIYRNLHKKNGQA